MKTKLFWKTCAMLLALWPACTYSQFQSQVGPLGYGNYLRINPAAAQNQSAVGIGKFTTAPLDVPQALLHVKSFLMQPTGGTSTFSQGNLFRTDGNVSNNNVWALYTGTTAANTSENSRLWVPANQTHTGLRSRGDLFFETNSGTERMRIVASTGNTGLGTNDPNYLFHMHQPDGTGSFLQFTTTTTGFVSPTVGMRMGLNTGSAEAEIRHYDNTALNIYQNNQIRQRFTNGGTWNGLNGASAFNVNRMSMSLTGINLTPYSLLHMGTQGASNWSRVWMNVGTSYSANNDGMYVGLLERPTSENIEETDAVIAWADDPLVSNFGDNLRFIFLRPLGQFGTAGTIQGLEVGRFSPAGNLGVGDFSTTGYNIAPTQRIDVDGTARLRNLPLVAAAPKCLLVGEDGASAQDNVVKRIDFNGNGTDYLGGDGAWYPANAGTIIAANNGTSLAGGNTVELGNALGGTLGQLTTDREIPMNNNILVFTDPTTNSPNENRIGIGTNTPSAKVEIIKANNGAGETNSPALRVTNTDIDGTGIGVNSIALDVTSNNPFNLTNTAGQFNANGASQNNIGITATAVSTSGAANIGIDLVVANSTSNNTAIHGTATSNGSSNTGCDFTAIGGAQAIGGRFNASGGINPLQNSWKNVAVWGDVTADGLPGNSAAGRFTCIPGPFITGGDLNYGVFATCIPAQGGNPPLGPNYAGWFQGDLVHTGGFGSPSDEALKNDVAPLGNALATITALKPVTYTYDQAQYSKLGLPGGTHCGFIAQEAGEIVPSSKMGLIVTAGQAGVEGLEENTTLEFQGLNYLEFIPINTAAIQELKSMVDGQATQIQTLQQDLADANDNITTLAAAMEECCAIDLQLKSLQGNDIEIVPTKSKMNELYQNTPNPFYEATTIAFHLVLAAQAKVLIYDQSGQVIICLIDGHIESGLHQVQWNTQSLAAGIYYYALVVDGVEMVKKAVKL